VWCDTIARHFVKSLHYRYFSHLPCRRRLKGHLGNGLLLLSRKPITEEGAYSFSWYTRPDEFFANKGFQVVQLETPAGFLYVVNTHLGAGKKPKDILGRMTQLEELLLFIRTLPSNHPTLLAGDFNFGEHAPEYTYLRTWMKDSCEESQDTYRCSNPGRPGHTFFIDRSYASKPSAHHRDGRIDYIFSLASKHNRSTIEIVDSQVVLNHPDEHLSDHAGVMTTLSVARKPTIEQFVPLIPLQQACPDPNP
jgi:endonuclease/exonuclease/phosphatase family metal-dependent hydrolase